MFTPATIIDIKKLEELSELILPVHAMHKTEKIRRDLSLGLWHRRDQSWNVRLRFGASIFRRILKIHSIEKGFNMKTNQRTQIYFVKCNGHRFDVF